MIRATSGQTRIRRRRLLASDDALHFLAFCEAGCEEILPVLCHLPAYNSPGQSPFSPTSANAFHRGNHSKASPLIWWVHSSLFCLTGTNAFLRPLTFLRLYSSEADRYCHCCGSAVFCVCTGGRSTWGFCLI